MLLRTRSPGHVIDGKPDYFLPLLVVEHGTCRTLYSVEEFFLK